MKKTQRNPSKQRFFSWSVKAKCEPNSLSFTISFEYSNKILT